MSKSPDKLTELAGQFRNAAQRHDMPVEEQRLFFGGADVLDSTAEELADLKKSAKILMADNNRRFEENKRLYETIKLQEGQGSRIRSKYKKIIRDLQRRVRDLYTGNPRDPETYRNRTYAQSWMNACLAERKKIEKARELLASGYLDEAKAALAPDNRIRFDPECHSCPHPRHSGKCFLCDCFMIP